MKAINDESGNVRVSVFEDGSMRVSLPGHQTLVSVRLDASERRTVWNFRRSHVRPEASGIGAKQFDRQRGT